MHTARPQNRLRIALVANTSWYLHNFRTTLMAALRAQGHHIIAMAPHDAYTRKLTAAGDLHVPIPFDIIGLNPFRDLRTVIALRRAFRAHQVDLVLSFAAKGNIYSALALTDQAFVPNVSGLGRGFANGSPLQVLMRPLYRHAFAKAHAVLFQNDDDLELMAKARLIDVRKAQRIPGSGVDLGKFSPRSGDMPNGAPVFLFVARLLWSKGIGHYVEAARRIRRHHPNAQFRVLGALDPSCQDGPKTMLGALDPDSLGVPEAVLDGWVREGIIDYLGVTDDVRPHMAAAGCVVLPSYHREGVPRVLLEAAAMARPVLTTDAPGCRDAVDDGVTGFLCRPRDSDDLSTAMEKFCALPPGTAQAMGAAGREKMEREFDETLVIDRYLALVDGLPPVPVGMAPGPLNFRHP